MSRLGQISQRSLKVGAPSSVAQATWLAHLMACLELWLGLISTHSLTKYTLADNWIACPLPGASPERSQRSGDWGDSREGFSPTAGGRRTIEGIAEA